MSNGHEIICLELPATYKYLNVLGNCLQAVLERLEDIGDREVVVYNIQLAANEILANIIGHAYGGDASQRVYITLTCCPHPRSIVIEFEDTGVAFDPASAPAVDLDDVQVHGYGLFLVQTLMDTYTYERRMDRNHWYLLKYL